MTRSRAVAFDLVERTEFPGGTFNRSRRAPFHGARVIEIRQLACWEGWRSLVKFVFLAARWRNDNVRVEILDHLT